MAIEKMIHTLAKTYGQCKYYVEENYTELDYWECLYCENFDNAE
jgi:hypothetical protein